LNLENKINKAQYSAEKKTKGSILSHSEMTTQMSHDDIPLPHRHEILNEKL